MNQGRLRWLLAFMTVLVVVRVLVPNPSSEIALADPMMRTKRAPSPQTADSLAASIPLPTDLSEAADPEVHFAGNAFAVRRPASPVAEPSPTPEPTQIAVVAVPHPPAIQAPPPPPPPPPFKVIGTWDDGVAPGLFVSTPVGTQLARIGTVLLAEYRVTAITAQQLSLEHLATKQTQQLNFPRGTSP